MLCQHYEHKFFKYDVTRKKTDTKRIFTRTNTEDRRQGHHNSLVPITVSFLHAYEQRTYNATHITRNMNYSMLYVCVWETTRKCLNKFMWCVAFQFLTGSWFYHWVDEKIFGSWFSQNFNIFCHEDCDWVCNSWIIISNPVLVLHLLKIVHIYFILI